jgi:hypothetical protein
MRTELFDGGLELLVFFNILGSYYLLGSSLGAYRTNQSVIDQR